ncbi:MAG: hypothetical protein K2N80_07310 [Lachnospiraceae bacterium]|nr:hypothetical protein [Lachnospiraceae bacterium]
MVCKKCGEAMNWSIDGSTQGWSCPVCGWGIVTTYIDEIDIDQTEYCIYIKNMTIIGMEIIKIVAKIANVNFMIAKQMLQEKEACILKARAPEIKAAIAKLQESDIDFMVSPVFRY